MNERLEVLARPENEVAFTAWKSLPLTKIFLENLAEVRSSLHKQAEDIASVCVSSDQRLHRLTTLLTTAATLEKVVTYGQDGRASKWE